MVYTDSIDLFYLKGFIMKKLLLMGTTLVAIAPYISAMNQNPENSMRSQLSSGIDSISNGPFQSIATSSTNITPPPHTSKAVCSFKDWNDIWDGLWNPEITRDEYYEKLKQYIENNGKKTINPSEQNGSEMLEKLWNNIGQLDFEQLEDKAFDLWWNTPRSIHFEHFESQAAQLVEQLYHGFHNRISEDPTDGKTKISSRLKEIFPSNSKNDDHDNVLQFFQHLFSILIVSQKAEITNDLASKLLNDQDLTGNNGHFHNHAYIGYDTIAYLIAGGKCSLADLKETAISYYTFRNIIRSVSYYQLKDLREKPLSFSNVEAKTEEEMVREKLSLFQKNVIEPLQEIESFEKAMEYKEAIFEPLKKQIKECISGSEKVENRIEQLYYQKLNELITSLEAEE